MAQRISSGFTCVSRFCRESKQAFSGSTRIRANANAGGSAAWRKCGLGNGLVLKARREAYVGGSGPAKHKGRESARLVIN